MARSGLTDWEFGTLPQAVQVNKSGHVVTSYPAVVDEGSSVGVELFDTPDEQRQAMWAGTRRLLVLNRPSVAKPLRALLTNDVKLALVRSPYESPTQWFDDLLGCAVDHLMIEADAPPWNEPDWTALVTRMRRGLEPLITSLGSESGAILADLYKVEVALAKVTATRFEASAADVRAQLDSLFYPGCLTGLGARNLANAARYLKAADRRLTQLPENLRRDIDAMARVQALEHEHDRLAESLPWSQELEDITWQIQELRVSLFAQSVGAKGQVSEKRIRKALERLR